MTMQEVKHLLADARDFSTAEFTSEVKKQPKESDEQEGVKV